MDTMQDAQIETDITTQELILAASNHDIPRLRDLLRNTSANVQDPETGFTPLHAAIAAFEADDDVPQTNGHVNGTMNGVSEAGEQGQGATEVGEAVKTLRLLFQNGAIWNDLDADNETPGCIAKRLGLSELYDLVVDAGVRAELLLNRLDEYQVLGGDEDDEDEEEDAVQEQIREAHVDGTGATTAMPTSDAILTDHTQGHEPDLLNPNYLSSALSVNPEAILDSSQNAVMMSWEKDLMAQSAGLLLPSSGLRVLNIGHGMGIIDTFFQSHAPRVHHIVEAHPDVLKAMREQGWYEKSGVVIHEGRWQDVLPNLVGSIEEDGQDLLFDAIYFDTFAEDYKALRDFFSEWVIQVIHPDGRLSFFNGMGADRQACYDVYNKVFPYSSQDRSPVNVLTKPVDRRDGSLRSWLRHRMVRHKGPLTGDRMERHQATILGSRQLPSASMQVHRLMFEPAPSTQNVENPS